MNCKKGDLAMVVKTETGSQAGKVVKCVERFTGYFSDGTAAADSQFPWWVIEPPLVFFSKRRGKLVSQPFCPDRALMPIRPLEDVRETECLELIKEG